MIMTTISTIEMIAYKNIYTMREIANKLPLGAYSNIQTIGILPSKLTDNVTINQVTPSIALVIIATVGSSDDISSILSKFVINKIDL